MPQFFDLFSERLDTLVVLTVPLLHDVQFSLRFLYRPTGALDGLLLDEGGVAHAGDLRAEKFLLPHLKLLLAAANLALPKRDAVSLKPDASANNIFPHLVEDAARFIAVNDEAGPEGFDGFQRGDFGAFGGHGEDVKS